MFGTHKKLVNKSFNCSLFLKIVVTFKHFVRQIPIETIKHENDFSFLRQSMSGDCWGIVFTRAIPQFLDSLDFSHFC